MEKIQLNRETGRRTDRQAGKQAVSHTRQADRQ